jgi:hypothetical protein
MRLNTELADANESIWVFRSTDRVGGIGKPQVTALKQLGGKDCRRKYCGLTADWPIGTSIWPNPESSEPGGGAGLRFCPTPVGRLGNPRPHGSRTEHKRKRLRRCGIGVSRCSGD